MDEFKEFLKTIPSIKQDVLNGRYTWQQLYEIFVMYGKDDKFWLPYKTGNSGFDLNMLLEVIKNIDLNALSSSLGSIEKVLNVASTFLDKKEPARKENGMMNEEIRYYLRYHPNWYIVLSRYPQEYEHLIQEYKDGKNQQFIDKIDQVSMLINMVEMMM